jgi:hypothetical protein
LILLIAAMLFAVGAVSADLTNWQVKCGLGDNAYPFGNDFSTRFGVSPNGTWTYDGDDAAHPTVADPIHDLAFIYKKDYYKVYRDQILHAVPAGPDPVFVWTAPVGWPPPWGGHGTGTVPDYPNPGLIKDTRAPILNVAQPEIWLAAAYAPVAGASCSFVWEWNTDDRFAVPTSVEVKIWGNAQLETAGVFGDLVLNDYGDGVHKIVGIQQWGLDEAEENPLRKDWIIQATVVPEPAVAQLAGLVFGIAGLGIARFRRK